jgi:hypothetical protein
MKRPQRQRGLALVDVLIALLVLGLGVPAMSQLQGLILFEGGHSRTRASAAQLAREKLDDLRQFTQLDVVAANIFGFDEIGNDLGGRKNADGSLLLPAGDVVLSDVTYQRHWSASSYSWCAPGAALSAGICGGARHAALQQLRVTISWTDIDGQASTLSIETAIAALDPALASSALIRRPSLLPPVVVPK